MDFIQCLHNFDGKHTEPLEDLASQQRWDKRSIATLLDFAESDEPRLQIASTWVLKCLQERGICFEKTQVKRLLILIHKVDAWEGRLHLLQILPKLQIPSQQAKPLHQTLVRGLESEKNKFVRAWTYNGLIVLASQHERFRTEVSSLIAAGQQEEAASVKARIRNALKEVDWTL